MDDIVLKAMLKWPGVPSCEGWLGLDERGDWYMRDEQVQAMGSFKHGCSVGDKRIKGSKLAHKKLMAYIGRNYSSEILSNGKQAWYFQNGPQKVYVTLACTPYIWRLTEVHDQHGVPQSPVIRSHTGLLAKYVKCQLDATGRLFIHTDLGLGLVHSMDVSIAAVAIEKDLWEVNPEALNEDALCA